MLDNLISELGTLDLKISSSHNITEFVQLLPTAILESSQADLNFQSLLQFYQDDLPSLVSFNAEFDLWKHKWLSEPQLASELDTPGKTLVYSEEFSHRHSRRMLLANPFIG